MRHTIVAVLLLLAFSGEASLPIACAPTPSCRTCRKNCHCCPKGSGAAVAASGRPYGARSSQPVAPQSVERPALLPAAREIRPEAEAAAIGIDVAPAPPSPDFPPPAPPPRASL